MASGKRTLRKKQTARPSVQLKVPGKKKVWVARWKQNGRRRSLVIPTDKSLVPNVRKICRERSPLGQRIRQIAGRDKLPVEAVAWLLLHLGLHEAKEHPRRFKKWLHKQADSKEVR